MSQMKEQEKYTEKELNEMVATSLPDIESKTLVISMLKERRTSTKKIGSIKKRTEKPYVKAAIRSPAQLCWSDWL